MSRAEVRGSLTLLLLATALPAPSARADAGGLSGVETLLESGQFDDAELAAKEALGRGGLGRAEIARLHLVLGIVAAAKRDGAAAEASFRRTLELDPAAALPQSAGPHVGRAFESARSAAAGRPALAVRASASQAAPGRPLRVVAEVAGDAERLVDRVHVSGGSLRAERAIVAGRGSIEVPVPDALVGCLDVVVRVTDVNGNDLAEPGSARVCAGPRREQRTVAAERDEAPRPVPTLVWVGVGLGVVGGVATTVLGVRALERRDEYHAANLDPAVEVQERRRLRDDASSAQDLATLAGVATGVVGTATFVLWLTRPRATEPGVALAIDAGMTGVRGRF